MATPLTRRSLTKTPSLARCASTTAYVPWQSTHSIATAEVRPKPPPHFFTGKPHLYVTYDKLDEAVREIQLRLRQARCFPIGKPLADKSYKWKTQEELELMLEVPKIRAKEYHKLHRLFTRLLQTRHAADQAGDTPSVDRIDLLLKPFQVPQVLKDAEGSKAHLSASRVPDERGRSYSAGSRKTSKAQVWMQFTPTLAPIFDGTAEKERIQLRLADLAREKAEKAALAAEIKAAAGASLVPVFKRLDAEAKAAIEAKKRAGLLRPVDPNPHISPMEKIWKEEEEKRTRFRKKAEEMLKAEEAKASSPDATPTTDSINSPSSSTTLPTDHTASSPSTFSSSSTDNSSPTPPTPSSSYITPSPSKPTHTTLEPSIYSSDPERSLIDAVWAENKRLADEQIEERTRGRRHQPPSPVNSNHPERSVPKDGTIVVQTTTDAPGPSDPLLGQILINGVPFHRVFPDPKHREMVVRPLKVTRLLGAFNIFAIVHRGGQNGWAGAVQLAIARGIVIHQPAAKQALNQAGLLGIDNRQVERKKTGQPKARKNETWVKR